MRFHRSRTRRPETRAGFTLLELMIVVVVIAVAASLLVPNLFEELRKQRIRNHITETTAFMLSAKQEAVRRSVPVVIELDLAEDRFYAFANVDGDVDLDYDPDASEPHRTVDYEVGQLELPTAGNTLFMDFYGPTDGSARGPGMVDGLSTNGDGDPVIVFEPDGSIRDIGGVRFADFNANNFFELRIAPAATARIQLLKYNTTSNWGGPNFLPSGHDPVSGMPYWVWK